MPSSLEVIIDQLLHTLDATEEPNFGAILAALHARKFDGAITLHCHAGVPKIIEMGRVVRIDLTRRT